MARPAGPKVRCSGMWTEAYFMSFIKNQLRSASRKWKPIHDCKKLARVSHGHYLCSCCKEEVPTTIINEETRKRIKNVIVDHIEPIVPVTGWVSWDHCVNRMFCELSNLQVLCLKCHKIKCAEEAAERAAHKRKEKV
jgi:hypothetical protein